MNYKILASLLTIGVLGAGTTYGTFAFFSDTETATGNLFTAGDLDLTLNGLNGITGTIGATNFAPGDPASGSILLRNEGSIFTGDQQGHVVDLDLCVSVHDVDDLGNPAVDPDNGDFSLAGLSQWLTVNTFTYGGTDLIASLGDDDGDGRSRTLSDLATVARFTDVADPGAAGVSLALALTFATDGPNHLKRDVADLTFTFFLSQQGETDVNCAVAAAQADIPQTVYSSSFTTGADSKWSSTTTTVAPAGERFLGEFGSETATLDLASLPQHDTIRIEADLLILKSWDGSDPMHNDHFRIALDGSEIFVSSFSYDNHAAIPQCYPAQYPCGSSTSGPNTGATKLFTLGYTAFGYLADATYRVSFELPHTASTASIDFEGILNENAANEAWGLDNVRVTTL